MSSSIALPEILATLAAQQAPPSHLARLAALIALAEREPALRALFLVGSYAKGLGDRVSDLDLVMIAAAGQGERLLAAGHALLLASGELLNQFGGKHPGPGSGFFHKLVYLDFSSVELHVFEPGTAFRLRRPYLAVWDPERLQEAYVAEGEPVRHEDFVAYEHGDAGLIWDLVDCIKWLSRGRAALARRHIVKIAERIRQDGGG
ncbi:hypothetical protein G8A07_27635 [Roseateles sp. DAIF2]|uniref:nucleotidyltransferase domain-containing protein n=1 Tax=Roseateles sp. DAIF2 TaxID=2714952 RepID=UPI0018A26C26|nr:nucleotidyltransferase domain-containing protein [Roseateles sp. DAIF2]QPF76333.1 hypothetical protein G8A07_27635 [Roseateles sp. DAIF2]